MPESAPGPVSPVTVAAVMVLGLGLMLVGSGVFTVEPALHGGPRALVMFTGTVAFLLGILGIMGPRRALHPAAFRFTVALLVTATAALAVAITVNSHDEQLMIGPFVFRGPAVDAGGKVLLGLNAALLTAAAGWCWRWWWTTRSGRG